MNRCKIHDHPLSFVDTVEVVTVESGRELYASASAYVCPQRGCTERRLVVR